MLRYLFNEKKAAQAAARLVQLAGGKMPYIKLIKLLYLADREAILGTGLPITGDRYVSMKNGPVLSRVYDLIVDERPETTEWNRYIAAPERYDVSLAAGAPDFSTLSAYEQQVLEEVFNRLGHMDKFALCDLTHQICPEWRDPGESCLPIEPIDILRAEGKTPEEIQEYHEAAESVLFLEAIL